MSQLYPNAYKIIIIQWISEISANMEEQRGKGMKNWKYWIAQQHNHSITNENEWKLNGIQTDNNGILRVAHNKFLCTEKKALAHAYMQLLLSLLLLRPLNVDDRRMHRTEWPLNYYVNFRVDATKRTKLFRTRFIAVLHGQFWFTFAICAPDAYTETIQDSICWVLGERTGQFSVFERFYLLPLNVSKGMETVAQENGPCVA